MWKKFDLICLLPTRELHWQGSWEVQSRQRFFSVRYPRIDIDDIHYHFKAHFLISARFSFFAISQYQFNTKQIHYTCIVQIKNLSAGQTDTHHVPQTDPNWFSTIYNHCMTFCMVEKLFKMFYQELFYHKLGFHLQLFIYLLKR